MKKPAPAPPDPMLALKRENLQLKVALIQAHEQIGRMSAERWQAELAAMDKK